MRVTLSSPPSFRDIPQFTRTPTYGTDHSLDYLEDYITRLEAQGLNLLPDFQRGHVWTEEQQVAFVEFFLRGGATGRVIYMNFRGFARGRTPEPGNPDDEFVIVDGLQRLTAVLKFLRNELAIFGGWKRSDFIDKPRMMSEGILRININDLRTRKEVLQWYLEMNTGGTPHTDAEIERVRKLLERESSR